MDKRYLILPILIVLLIAAGSCAALDPDTSASTGNVSQTSLGNNSTSASPEITAPATTEQPSAPAVTPQAAPQNANLQFIWSVTGLESEQVTVALNQEEGNLYGPAKYEPSEGDAWNGVAVGTVSGNSVSLVITGLKGSELVSSMLTGAFNNDVGSISGKFFQVSGGKISSKGDFSAYSINDDLTSFTPAKVTTAAAPTSTSTSETPQVTNNNTAAPQTETTTSSDTSTTTQVPVKLGGNTAYTDVHKYAQQYEIGGDLSGVPPGMGGTGGLS